MEAGIGYEFVLDAATVQKSFGDCMALQIEYRSTRTRDKDRKKYRRPQFARKRGAQQLRRAVIH